MCAQKTQGKQETNMQTMSPFTSYENDRLERIQRFLVNVTDPNIAPKVSTLGYDSKEHRQGWDDWNIAAGVQVPFEYHLSETKRKVAMSHRNTLQTRIRFLDQAENTWFPRARNAIRRFVEPTQRETFEQAFFENMPQQPEGPMVVGSIEKFLGRIESMKTSPVAGAKDAYISLQKKGLTDEIITQLKTTIIDLKKEFADLPQPDISPNQIQQASEKRRTGYERLNLWYTDWAETLRQELGYHDQVRLGLTEVKGGRTSYQEEEPTTTNTQSTIE